MSETEEAAEVDSEGASSADTDYDEMEFPELVETEKLFR